jgi:hypothetical protein
MTSTGLILLSSLGYEIPLGYQIVYYIGEITLIILGCLIITVFTLVGLSLYSMRSGNLIFPGFLKAGMVLLEGFAKALFRLFGLEDREVQAFFIQIQNAMNKKVFASVPVAQRAIFLPQCLRSSICPAHLTPEGLKCKSCGSCGIEYVKRTLEQMGYHLFIVPGSSFIKRMVKQYHPKAIIGVGCLSEVKDGLEMADKIGLIAMGVVTLKEGCVETLVNWDDLFEVAILGLDPDSIPEEIKPGHPPFVPT